MDIKVKSNISDIQLNIKKRIEKFRTLKTPLKLISTELYQSVMQNFREQGTDKQKWEPLSKITKFIRRHRASKPNKSPVILQDTGSLRQSIYPETGSDYASVSTNLKYAKEHQFGGMSKPSSIAIAGFWRKHPKDKNKKVRVRPYILNIKGGAKIPARPFLTIRKVNLDRIINICKNWFFEGVK